MPSTLQNKIKYEKDFWHQCNISKVEMCHSRHSDEEVLQTNAYKIAQIMILQCESKELSRENPWMF